MNAYFTRITISDNENKLHDIDLVLELNLEKEGKKLMIYYDIYPAQMDTIIDSVCQPQIEIRRIRLKLEESITDFVFKGKVEENTIEKYRGKIPDQMIEFWEKY